LHVSLEGTLLSKEPSLTRDHNGSETLLIGIMLHKIPESFAMVAVLLTRPNRRQTFFLLLVFALAPPVGMVSTQLLYHQNIIGREFTNSLFGLVAGGFLHISTMIFFESSSQHKFQFHKLLIIRLAAGLAMMSEYVI